MKSRLVSAARETSKPDSRRRNMAEILPIWHKKGVSQNRICLQPWRIEGSLSCHTYFKCYRGFSDFTQKKPISFNLPDPSPIMVTSSFAFVCLWWKILHTSEIFSTGTIHPLTNIILFISGYFFLWLTALIYNNKMDWLIDWILVFYTLSAIFLPYNSGHKNTKHGIRDRFFFPEPSFPNSARFWSKRPCRFSFSLKHVLKN